MRVTISKILNKTDLAQSGSHGGLVVTKADQNALDEHFRESFEKMILMAMKKD